MTSSKQELAEFLEISKTTNLMETQDELTKEEPKETLSPPNKHSSKKRIGPYKYYMHKKIGDGFSSNVFKCKKDGNKDFQYAVKVVNLHKLNEEKRKMLQSQVKILSSVKHPNILKVEDVFYTENNCYIITELCSEGSLKKIIADGKKINWIQLIKQIGLACQYLSANNIIHRDIKSDNIFFGNGSWKLGDFGFARFLPHNSSIIQEKYCIGSPVFMPYESLQFKKYSSKGDSFAVGVLLFYIFTKSFPWYKKSKSQLIESHLKETYKISKMKYIPRKIKNIIQGLLLFNQEQRLSLLDLNFNKLSHENSQLEIKLILQSLKSNVKENVVICQYIKFILKNISCFEKIDQQKEFEKMAKEHLCHLTLQFDWQSIPYLNKMKFEYNLETIQKDFNIEKYQILQQKLKNMLKKALQCGISKTKGIEKILQYFLLVSLILKGNTSDILDLTSQFILHSDFTLLTINEENHETIKTLIDFY